MTIRGKSTLSAAVKYLLVSNHAHVSSFFWLNAWSFYIYLQTSMHTMSDEITVLSPVSVLIAAHDTYEAISARLNYKMTSPTTISLWFQSHYCKPWAQPFCYAETIKHFHDSFSRLTVMRASFSLTSSCIAALNSKESPVTTMSSEQQQWCK